MLRLLAVTALALFTTLAFAQGVAPGDRVYDLRSEAQGSCPALRWHIVADQAGVLSGTIAWDDMKKVAGVSGTIRPLVKLGQGGNPKAANPQNRTFSMIATGSDGVDRVAEITGTIWPNGWFSANIQGIRMACHNVKVQ
jgi:hypothetical protein